jgi:hypothetical protein
MTATIERLRPQIRVETTTLGEIDAMLCDVKTGENLTPWANVAGDPGVRAATDAERARFVGLYGSA